ncbi:hypothetical protein M5K25_015123 [Dendrobium thyrsiflorum]|uniref:Uncharacterized protein n=1 Tax=Dendrobium thyrsiflorum TaxID=117978 RepID=A0ABD0UPI9_DENTH
MAAKKVDALEERLEGEMNQIKTTVEERMSSMEGQVADLRDMIKKMLEVHNQTAASVAKSGEGRSTNSEIRREEEELIKDNIITFVIWTTNIFVGINLPKNSKPQSSFSFHSSGIFDERIHLIWKEKFIVNFCNYNLDEQEHFFGIYGGKEGGGVGNQNGASQILVGGEVTTIEGRLSSMEMGLRLDEEVNELVLSERGEKRSQRSVDY